jgi:hypothetical protein
MFLDSCPFRFHHQFFTFLNFQLLPLWSSSLDDVHLTRGNVERFIAYFYFFYKFTIPAACFAVYLSVGYAPFCSALFLLLFSPSLLQCYVHSRLFTRNLHSILIYKHNCHLLSFIIAFLYEKYSQNTIASSKP